MQASIKIISENSINAFLENASLESFRKADFEKKDLKGYENILQFLEIEENKTNVNNDDLLTIAGISCLKHYRLDKEMPFIALRYEGSVYATYFSKTIIRIIQ
ncbi:MAG: hypothetical protein JW791_04525 [Nanoarchaeota archaeon]|nr:hypothetical protein [Nanoarchaeota archaeon]